ncbi:hypothetical protein GQ607_015760 [Colletotrichum asianum]|uniref:Uncharacterized protein n=1 Tax=Colletotrichum asianum TaxID=702518 RepID=A0A8H3VWZ8_9PEZI|nr:hypothetical protein GQ607_015760 [Colletotrichum asianum]
MEKTAVPDAYRRGSSGQILTRTGRLLFGVVAGLSNAMASRMS